MHKTILLAACCFIISCANGGGQLSSFRVNTSNEGDHSAVQITSDEAIFSFFSSKGIGRGKVEVVEGAWPERVYLRLYLGGLESLELEREAYTIKTSIPSSTPDMRLQSIIRKGSSIQQREEIESSSPLWLEINRVKENSPPAAKFAVPDQYFQIELPRAFLESDEQGFAISWIDFYR